MQEAGRQLGQGSGVDEAFEAVATGQTSVSRLPNRMWCTSKLVRAAPDCSINRIPPAKSVVNTMPSAAEGSTRPWRTSAWTSTAATSAAATPPERTAGAAVEPVRRKAISTPGSITWLSASLNIARRVSTR